MNNVQLKLLNQFVIKNPSWPATTVSARRSNLHFFIFKIYGTNPTFQFLSFISAIYFYSNRTGLLSRVRWFYKIHLNIHLVVLHFSPVSRFGCLLSGQNAAEWGNN